MKWIERIIFTFALLAGFLTFASAQESNGEPVKLIIDTDFGPDCDDAGALALAHYLMGTGEAEIIGVVTSTYNHPIVPAIDVINTYYGRPEIPIGHIGSDGVRKGSDWTKHLSDNFPYQKTNDAAPHSTLLYRKLLHKSEQPVNIVVIGFQSAISAFLNSEANHKGDGIPYTGMDLAKNKVEKLILMAGDFDNPRKFEWNVKNDVNAAQNIAKNWPGEIIYTGFEIGWDIHSGGALTDPDNNPVAMAYKMSHRTMPRPGSGKIGDNHSWDLVAVFEAIRGNEHDGERFWKLSDYGKVIINKDSEPHTSLKVYTDGKHRYHIKDKNPKEIGVIFDEMITAAPSIQRK